MSSVPVLKKEESIIFDNNNDNSLDNKEKNNSNNKIIETKIISQTQNYEFSLSEEKDHNPKLKEENKKNQREQKKVVCWNCQSILIVKDGWEIAECSECHKLNRISKNDFDTIDQRISVAKSYGNLNQDVPYIYGIAICPICQTENKFKKTASNVTCSICGNLINVTNSLFNNNYYKRNIDNNFNNRSYDFSSPISYINTPYNPNFIQIRGFMPMAPCHGNCAECTLNKILKALKKPNNTYIPYPMLHYRYDAPKKEIQYIPINTENKKVEPEDQYKIVIRKKPKGRNIQSFEKYNSPKNKVFVKVFFSNK